jgi:hypothetical protein
VYMAEPFFVLPVREHDRDADRVPQHGPWSGPPDDVTGVDMSPWLQGCRSLNATISVEEVRAFPTGVGFVLSVTATADDRPVEEFYGDGLKRSASGNRPPDSLLRFGVRLSDGTTATTLENPVGRSSEPSGPVLVMLNDPVYSVAKDMNAMGMRARLWLWPLPPPGKLDLLVEWPLFGLDISTLAFDGTALRKAGQSAADG